MTNPPCPQCGAGTPTTPQHSVTEQAKPVAIVTGSTVQWLPGAGKLADRTELYAQPLASTAASEQQAEQASDFAVRFIEQRAQQYLQDHADYEPETGALVFEFGEAGRDYHSTLVELADDLRTALQHIANGHPQAQKFAAQMLNIK